MSGHCRLITEFILHHERDVATIGSDNGMKESEEEDAGEPKAILRTHWAALDGVALGGTAEGQESHEE